MNARRTLVKVPPVLALFAVALMASWSSVSGAPAVVKSWISSEDLKHKLEPAREWVFAAQTNTDDPAVRVSEEKTYQTIFGLGSSLEHSTCYNLSLLPPDRRRKAVESLVDPEKGIGMSLMRLCIGTADFTASPWYTYDDCPACQTDPDLKRFSIAKDREYVLPVLKLVREVNPRMKFFASPWSPPGWMKTSGRICGGQINPEHFGSLARYLARFVEAYREEGIEVSALTPQNEPEYAPDTYPTCLWTAPQQRDFIRDHLGPAFRERGLRTMIWCYDHNFNHLEFPSTILQDEKAAAFVEGTAFHHYDGKPEAMTALQGQFPNKHIYFTEGSTFGIEGAVRIIDLLRNWARSYSAWVTMIDHRRQPNPGPHPCGPTCVVLNRDTLELTYRFDYFMYGQFMKFIRPGAVRIDSSQAPNLLPNVAFRNPDGSLILVVVNAKAEARKLPVAWRNHGFVAELGPESIATYRWQPAVD